MDNKEITDIIIQMNENIKENNEILKRIEYKLDNNVTTECEKMGTHIDFIETIYERLRHPLNYICETYSNISPDLQRIGF